jgi:hypothetical protein
MSAPLSAVSSAPTSVSAGNTDAAEAAVEAITGAANQDVTRSRSS